MQEPKGDWVFDEPTVEEEERETTARENMAKGLAELVSASVSATAALVVARGPGLPTGVVLGDADRRQEKGLDPVVLGEILANAHDDRVVLALVRLLLGDNDSVEHAVARDRDGAVMGVIAVRVRGRVSKSWLRVVLSRAANSLAGWQVVSPSWSWPPQSLIEMIREPALAHECGMVIVANSALARMIGCIPDDVIGTPLSKITQRVQPVRQCSLVVGGRPRTALIFERRPMRVETKVIDAIERVLADHYPLMRHTLRVSLERREQVAAMVTASAVEEIVTLALLDVTAIFTATLPTNQVRINVYADDPWAVIELVATGSIATGAESEHEIEHIGSVICAARTRAVGGQFLLDTSQPDTRVIRISLPVES